MFKTYSRRIIKFSESHKSRTNGKTDHVLKENPTSHGCHFSLPLFTNYEIQTNTALRISED